MEDVDKIKDKLFKDIETHKNNILQAEKEILRAQTRIRKSKEKFLIKTGWEHRPSGAWLKKGHCQTSNIEDAFDVEIHKSF